MASATPLCPRIPEITFGCTPLRRMFVVRVCRKSCHPPIARPSSFATGRTYRFKTFPGLTGVPSLERKIHSPPPSCLIRDINSDGIGSFRHELSLLTVSRSPLEILRVTLQDLVNFIGHFLGFEVNFGRYRGVAGEMGFDGYWKSPTVFHVVVEVKTRTTTMILFRFCNRHISALDTFKKDH